jgi:hypothetical protein
VPEAVELVNRFFAQTEQVSCGIVEAKELLTYDIDT